VAVCLILRISVKVDAVIAPGTTFLKASDRGPGGNHQAKWLVIDAEGMTVGRLATRLATVLMGKHRPDYTPHVDTGDYVIVVNADKIQFSGGRMAHDKHPHYTTKMSKKSYVWFTGWPSGQREIPAIDLWEKKPTEILKLAVKRMLPKNALATHMLDKLKLFVGPDHTHQAQQPQPFPEYLMPK
jgi:large subunit ribosomal protein L13